MGSRRRSWFLIYALGAALTLGALSWISVVVLELERSERRALADGRHQETVRLALWRMDSWFGPQLSREVARLPLEYEAYTPQNRAYTRILNKIEPGEVLVPSPLLTFESEILPVHFQVDADGWSSPQLPTSNWLDLAQADELVDEETLARRRRALGELTRLTDYADLDRRLGGAEKNFNELFVSPEGPGAVQQQLENVEPPQQQWYGANDNVRERQERATAVHQSQNPVQAPVYQNDALVRAAPDVTASSPLVPLWLRATDSTAQLCFVRRVRVTGGDRFQGFLADWEKLEGALLERVVDLLPEATLVPELDASPEADHEGRLLATVPATLQPGDHPIAGAGGWSPAATTLLATWIAALVALGAVGSSLRASIRYGEQRSRFASTVTHELRTPLTTFRMYSEMLAKGMVPEEKRLEYLTTLERESDRLSTLVENVLAYSRLEEGRASLRRAKIDVDSLLARVRPGLERRVLEVGMTLRVEVGDVGELTVETDVEAVGQILFNLVDNACKYGRDGGGGAVELLAGATAGLVELRVRDHGAGVPPAVEGAIFQAFDRGGLDPSDPHPGVGLGLALARGLARDLGGDLVLSSRGGDQGACFKVSLPREPR